MLFLKKQWQCFSSPIFQVQPTGHENSGFGIVCDRYSAITPCTIVSSSLCACAWCAASRIKELVSYKKIRARIEKANCFEQPGGNQSRDKRCCPNQFTMGEYGASLEELRALMEYRGAEAKEKIDADYGGITGLCERLKTDPNNGIPNTTTELERRRAVFGANEIPPHPPKCFLQLVWEALQVRKLFV
ncbi:cation transporter/ATPase [Ostertagia ostertagi]